MKTFAASITAIASILSGVVVDAQSCRPVTTVGDFDLTQYASAPWYVQQQAENTYTPLDRDRCVTAQYNLKDDSVPWWKRSWWGYTVDVFNYAEDGSGSSSGGKLCADYDRSTPSKLKVAPCFLPKFFAGPYWIVAHREGDDGYALVSGGQPEEVVEDESDCGPEGAEACCKTGDGINNSGLWILTRQASPSDALVDEVRGIAKEKGFATSVLFGVTHDDDCDVPDIGDSTRLLRSRQPQ